VLCNRPYVSDLQSTKAKRSVPASAPDSETRCEQSPHVALPVRGPGTARPGRSVSPEGTPTEDHDHELSTEHGFPREMHRGAQRSAGQSQRGARYAIYEMVSRALPAVRSGTCRGGRDGRHHRGSFGRSCNEGGHRPGDDVRAGHQCADDLRSSLRYRQHHGCRCQ
jgi:hypothetical protein